MAMTRREAKGKGEERYLNLEFQRIERRDKKAFLSDQCKEIEENNRMGKSRDHCKKIEKTTEWETLEISSRKLEIPREHFMQRWAQ